ncbi:MAG: alpha/beta hydrolase [Betaproteobacteria bacterium]|nr:alpha/beta hydrolase [Betaproteobacteria bacterium]
MSEREAAVLVHGLWVHGAVMALMRRRIARCGYRALSYSYPSVRVTLTENADRLAHYCRTISASKLHFVGHSLGGLVILRMLERAPQLNVGRVVLAGTPFGDSFSAQRLARLPGGRAALGRSMLEWQGRSRSLELPNVEIGVIAGDVAIGLGRVIAPALPKPNDGVVCVEETRLAAMRDHVVLRVNHTGMLLSAAVARRICEFLRSGAFARPRGGR